MNEIKIRILLLILVATPVAPILAHDGGNLTREQHLYAHTGIGLMLLIGSLVCVKLVVLFGGILRRCKNIQE